MAHNLNFNEITGEAAFYTVKEKAWHNLGYVSYKYEPSSEVIKKAQLDYTVAKEPIEYTFPSGKKTVSSTDYYTYQIGRAHV